MPPTVAVLTADGVGAVAVIRIAGEGALRAVAEVFRSISGRTLDYSAYSRPRFGRIGDGLGDEVVVVAASDEDVEIHCHGGTAAVALVVDSLVAAGTVRESASPDLLSIAEEAAEDVAHATTLRTASHLLDQLIGALEARVRTIEAAISRRSDEAIGLIEGLLATSSLGLRLVEGWKVAIAGRPNVGKSRLLNALAGFDRSIVSPTAGTTRDYVGLRTAFEGWPVELVDTAGLRASVDPIEAAGVERAHAVQAQADLVLLVLDGSQPLTDEDRELIARFPDAPILKNKCDLPTSWNADLSVTEISAERGDGIAELAVAIGRTLVPTPPAQSSPLLFRKRHVRAMQSVHALVQNGDWLGAVEAIQRMLRPHS